MRMLASKLRSKSASRTPEVSKAVLTRAAGDTTRMPRLGTVRRGPQRWYAEANSGSPPVGTGQSPAHPAAEAPRIVVRDGFAPSQPAQPAAPATAKDPINHLVRVLFKRTYDELPLNDHYTVVHEIPGDYALLYKGGHHLLHIECKVQGLDRITLPLNPADEMRVLESKAFLEELVADVRAQPDVFYPWTLEGVHLMRLELDPLYKPRPPIRKAELPVVATAPENITTPAAGAVAALDAVAAPTTGPRSGKFDE